MYKNVRNPYISDMHGKHTQIPTKDLLPTLNISPSPTEEKTMKTQNQTQTPSTLQNDKTYNRQVLNEGFFIFS
jgi:hypothetical protein